jgi:hypothetical protein
MIWFKNMKYNFLKMLNEMSYNLVIFSNFVEVSHYFEDKVI